MKPITHNDRTYTQLYAWYPVQTDSGGWIWFEHYYIRPDHHFEGCLLTGAEMLAESHLPAHNHVS